MEDDGADGSPPTVTEVREGLYVGALTDADRMVNMAEAARMQVMLAGLEAMVLEVEAETGQPVEDDSPAVVTFRIHQGFVLHRSRHEMRHRVETALRLRDGLPGTWAVFCAGGTSERVATIAATESIGLAAEHLAAFDAVAAELVRTETPRVVEKKLADLRDALDPVASATRHRDAVERRHVRARAEGDGMGSITIHAPAITIAAVMDRVRTDAVAAHGRDGECRSLGVLMADRAAELLLADTSTDDPAYPIELLGSEDQPDRARISATVLVIVPAETATGAGNAPAEVAGMGTIDAETARQVIAHTTSWTRVLADPVDDAVLGFDSSSRYIPTALRKLIHLKMPTCAGDDCGLPAHRGDIDHITRHEHDGRTRHTNLHPLCRSMHDAKDGGYLEVKMRPDGRPEWDTKWGARRTANTRFTIRRPAYLDQEHPPF